MPLRRHAPQRDQGTPRCRALPRLAAALSVKVFGISALVATLTPAPAVQAQEVGINPRTVAVRIDVAGRQRMLTQRMAKSLCYARSGVDVLANVSTLFNASALYGQSHRAFIDGDAKMLIFPEQDDTVLAGWDRVNRLWTELARIYDAALAGEVITEDRFGRANELAMEVMTGNNDLVAYLRAAYAGDIGAGGTGAAILIDLYGRQRMLSQKLSKEVCLAAWGYRLQDMRGELQATTALFDNSLNAFIDGLPIAGVPPAPSPEIDTQLRLARDIWLPVKEIAEDVAAGRSVGLNELAKFNQAMDAFLPEMNEAVGMLARLQGAEGA